MNVTIPTTLKKRGGRKEIILPEDSPAYRPPTQTPLVIALARAVGLDRSYVRLLNLTLLVPDIAQAILDGREPSGLSLERLVSFPLEWAEQRSSLC